MKFLKRCFSCGTKVEKVYNGLCEKCYKEKNPPIKEIKKMNLKICNQCRKIHYNNYSYTIDEIEKMLPNIMKNRVILNEGYKFNFLEIKDFNVLGNKLKFDIEVDCDLV